MGVEEEEATANEDAGEEPTWPPPIRPAEQSKASLLIQHLSTQGNSKCFTNMKDIKKHIVKWRKRRRRRQTNMDVKNDK